MRMPEPPAGIALLCDDRGHVLRVVCDQLNLGERAGAGRDFAELVDAASAEKARGFLATLRRQRAAFDWELNVMVGDQLTPLHFAGVEAEGGLFVVGARSRSGVARFYEEMIEINNEQANSLRAAAKDLSRQSRAGADRDSHLYDELSRLNNELATAQRELAKKNAELARLNDQKNQFLGIAAHDLRNPLDVILTYSRFLLDAAAPRLTREQVEFVHTIRSSSEFMLRLVNDLLDISRIEAGKLQLDLEPVDLAALLRRNAALNRVLAERKSIHLLLFEEAEVPPFALDASKIEQVLNNLIGNAIKFSPPGGLVEVRLARAGPEAVVSVADTGPGIPAAEREQLFRPFGKTSAKGTAGEKGAGLGLAIVQKIVLGHGGRIWVESEPGRGSTFYVALPLAPPHGLSLAR